MSEINFKDYAPFYIGCRCFNTWFPENHPEYDRLWILTGYHSSRVKPYGLENEHDITWTDSIKPILRKLQDITDEECWAIHLLSPFWTEGTSQKYMMDRLYLIRERVIHQHLIPTVFHYLLKQGFDLFKLIENSKAIDSKTLK